MRVGQNKKQKSVKKLVQIICEGKAEEILIGFIKTQVKKIKIKHFQSQ